MELNQRQKAILNILSPNNWNTRTQINEKLNQSNDPVSFMTVNRDITYLIDLKYIERQGNGKASSYRLSPHFNVLKEINSQEYFKKDINEREIKERFNFDIFTLLSDSTLIRDDIEKLSALNKIFQQNYEQLSQTIKKKEFERATIDLSWKSSALEGNTYTLLETETLLKEGIEATGKKKEETIMIINHKNALEYIRQNQEEFNHLTVQKIEHLHSILIKDLEVTNNIRKTLVGITGTNYKPLDNEYQIREALEKYCLLINGKTNIFEKALITIPLIGYIQPFEDGNKRTGRILANALLISAHSFPISLRNLDINEYKESMLLFYEQNNISLLKRVFLQQCTFAVENYFKVAI